MEALSSRFVISVMFRDQVGIVAGISEAIARLGGNLLDVSQTVMAGYFSMILLAEFPPENCGEGLLKALEAIPGLRGAQFGILPYDASQALPAVQEKDTYILTASGPDRPGLVAKLSSYLKERSINIVDLSSRNHNGVYTMVWQIQIPGSLDVQKLQKSMRLAFQTELDIGLRHEALFEVTNEI